MKKQEDKGDKLLNLSKKDKTLLNKIIKKKGSIFNKFLKLKSKKENSKKLILNKKFRELIRSNKFRELKSQKTFQNKII